MPKALPIDLPSDVANAQPFTIPEGATVAEIDLTVEAIRKSADKLLDKDTKSDKSAAQRMAEATWLIDAAESLKGRKTEIIAEQEAESAKMDELRNRLGQPKPEGDDEDEDAEGGEGEHRDGDTPEGGEGGAGVVGEQAPIEPVLVASAAAVRRRSAIADAAANKGGQPQPFAPGKARTATLVASAQVPDFRAGQELTWAEMGVAAENRFRNLPSAESGAQGYHPLAIGQVRVASDPGLVASGMVTSGGQRAYDLDAAIEWALSPERLRRETGVESLTAAGGWCAPSETMYDLVDVTTDDGMVDVAGITVSRGGVRYSLGPDFSAVYSAGANFTKTEAQAIAGSAKPVVNIPCPTFTDNRMNVDGLYLTGDILSAKGYPEAYADFTSKALKAFAHYVNKQTLADMELLCTTVNLVEGGSPPPYENKSVATELLGAVELQVTDMRYRNRMSLTQMVEVVFPYWAIGTIRSDIAKRAGLDTPAAVSNDQINQWFALRGASVQWVYDWQDFFATGSGLGGATPAVGWPSQVKFMIYPQGGFVRALSDVIELNAVYDSTLLTTNQYVALFMEQARLTLKRVPDVRVVTTKVFVTGATGATYDLSAKQPTV